MRCSIFSVVDHHPDRPGSVGAFCRQILDEVALAERLGFDTHFLAEHHFHAYGVASSPPVLLANFGAMPAAQVSGSLSRFMAQVPARVDILRREPATVASHGDA